MARSLDFLTFRLRYLLRNTFVLAIEYATRRRRRRETGILVTAASERIEGSDAASPGRMGGFNHRQPKLLLCVGCYIFGLVTALVFSDLVSHEDGSLRSSANERQGSAALLNARNHARLASDTRQQVIDLLSHSDPYVNAGNREMESLSKVGTGEMCSTALSHIDLPYIWFVFKPTWNCVAKERLGELYDGGKWQCNVDALAKKRDCVVYSLGSSAVVGYEQVIAGRTGCEIHVFDPTVSAKLVQPLLPPGATFHEIGIAGHTGTKDVGGKLSNVSTIQDAMKRLNHGRLSVLKMDIEGYEYEAIEALAQSGALAESIDELLVEFHWSGIGITIKTFQRILDAGFYIFSNEPNLFFRPLPAAGIEYSFVHSRVADAYNS